MTSRNPKWQGKRIEVDGKVGTIIYAGGQQLLVEFEDKTRTWLTRPVARDGDEFKILDEVSDARS